MKIIELYTKIAKREIIPRYIKVNDKKYEFDSSDNEYYPRNENDSDTLLERISRGNVLLWLNIEVKELSSLEEEKELHANNIEFNINNDKRDCVITLDENDLGIDKLHLDNCYFYKENDKWYVKKYDFKTIELEEKKIPEKLELPSFIEFKTMTPEERYVITAKEYDVLNDLIDYLKSKGE